MIITLFDAIGLYLALKATELMCKEKRSAVLANAVFTLIFVLTCIAIVDKALITDSSFIFLFLLLLLTDVFYLFAKPNNKGFVTLATFLFVVLAWNSTAKFTHWQYLILALPMVAHLLACDCSDIKGYTTMNTMDALGWLIFGFVSLDWFIIVIGLAYLVTACFMYLRENKLDALTKKNKATAKGEQVVKENREARRARERQEKRAKKKGDKKS